MYDHGAITKAIEVLKQADSTTLIKHQGFNDWLFKEFVPSCDTETRNTIKSLLRKRRSGKSKTSAASEGLKVRFTTWASKDGTIRKSPRDILMALEDFQTQVCLNRHTTLMKEDEVCFWKECVSLSNEGVKRPTLPLERLLQTYHASERATLQVEAELEDAQAEERLAMPGGKSNVSQAVQTLSANHDLDANTINDCRSDGAGWLRFIEEWGFGAIMLPVKEGNLYEKQISEKDFKLMLRFCREEWQHVSTAIESLNDIAGRIFWEGLKFHRIPYDKFLQSNGTVSRYFIKHCGHLIPRLLPNMDSGATRLDTLASAAASRPDQTDQHISFPGLTAPTPQTQIQSGGIVVPHKSGTVSSVSQQIGNRRDMENPWQPLTDPSWSPNTTAPGLLLASTESAPTYQFDQTAIGNCMAPPALNGDDAGSGYWPSEWFGQFVDNFEG